MDIYLCQRNEKTCTAMLTYSFFFFLIINSYIFRRLKSNSVTVVFLNAEGWQWLVDPSNGSHLQYLRVNFDVCLQRLLKTGLSWHRSTFFIFKVGDKINEYNPTCKATALSWSSETNKYTLITLNHCSSPSLWFSAPITDLISFTIRAQICQGYTAPHLELPPWHHLNKPHLCN